MKKIEIKIPDGLSPEKEVMLVAKQLLKKQLADNKKDQKLIGSGVTVEHIQTQITVTRESKEPIIEIKKCNVCGNDYQSDLAVNYWHNYGGVPKSVGTCSNECRDAVIAFLGNRAAISKNKLKAVRAY